MKYEVITSMNEELYNVIGHKMISSFLENWPEDAVLWVYMEEDFTIPENSRIVKSSIQDDPAFQEFVSRHSKRFDQLNKKELHKGAIRFAPKSFTIFNHCIETDTDFVIWMDSDIETFAPMNKNFINSLVREGVYTTFLGREDTFTEGGLVVYNVKHEKNEAFMEHWRIMYEFDQVFRLDEWHDCAIFDYLRNRLLTEEEQLNLSPWGRGFEHVFNNSILGAYMDHMKGPRKELGHSYFEDLSLEIATPQAIERYEKWKKG